MCETKLRVICDEIFCVMCDGMLHVRTDVYLFGAWEVGGGNLDG